VVLLKDLFRVLRPFERDLVTAVSIGVKARRGLAILGAKMFRALQNVAGERARAGAVPRDEERGVVRRWERSRRDGPPEPGPAGHMAGRTVRRPRTVDVSPLQGDGILFVTGSQRVALGSLISAFQAAPPPERRQQDSPGQRPGKTAIPRPVALKGRKKGR